MKARYLFVALFCLGISNSLSALTAAKLVEYCKAIRISNPTMTDIANQNFCTGYILGITDSILIQQNAVDLVTGKPLAKKFICMPDEVDSKELILVYLKAMDDHPETLHVSAWMTVYNSINRTYHCPNMPQPTP